MSDTDLAAALATSALVCGAAYVVAESRRERGFWWDFTASVSGFFCAGLFGLAAFYSLVLVARTLDGWGWSSLATLAALGLGTPLLVVLLLLLALTRWRR